MEYIRGATPVFYEKGNPMTPHNRRLLIYLTAFIAIMGMGTFGFMALEGFSPVDAFYFSFITIATVGYGDLHPVTQAGRIFTIILVVMGVSTFLGLVGHTTELMLSRLDEKSRLNKIHVISGTFFSQIGTTLLHLCSSADSRREKLEGNLTISESWPRKKFAGAENTLAAHEGRIDIERIDLAELSQFLAAHKGFMVDLMGNPALLEDGSFTRLLWAILHLDEELTHREDLSLLPPADRGHIAGDILRAYRLLSIHWIEYMQYLKNHFPYMFSLAVRRNPFDRKACTTVTSPAVENGGLRFHGKEIPGTDGKEQTE